MRCSHQHTQASSPTRTDHPPAWFLSPLASLVLLLIGGMVFFVLQKAWPSFSHNGLAWFGAGGNVDQQLTDIFNSPASRSAYEYTLHAWPLIYGTALITLGAVILATIISVLSAIFIVEFAPEAIRRFLEPAVRLLAAVPSVIYGLIGILVVVPWVQRTFISDETRDSVKYVLELDGTGVTVAVVILTVMITPIMIAIVVDALRAVPQSWSQGAAALGVNRWRATMTVTVRSARPAIIAAGVLATARALGEAIMLSLVSGSNSFAPNPLDGLTFFVEPTRPLAASIVENIDGASVEPFGQTLYAFAAVLLVSAGMLSFAGSIARRRLRKYGLAAT
ncbi:phosphate ABC transporter permease subunit PstC [soil metagenome]